jgi:hypothetical protein
VTRAPPRVPSRGNPGGSDVTAKEGLMTTRIQSERAIDISSKGSIDLKLEVVGLPVSGVDCSKRLADEIVSEGSLHIEGAGR